MAPSPKKATDTEPSRLRLLDSAGADHRRDAAADDGVGAEMAELHVGDMHGAALAVAVAIHLAGDLGHHALGVGAAGEEDAVAAMVGGEGVLRLHRRAHARRRRLLADRQMQHGAGGLAAHEQFADALLEAADAPHGPIEIEQRRTVVATPARSVPLRFRFHVNQVHHS